MAALFRGVNNLPQKWGLRALWQQVHACIEGLRASQTVGVGIRNLRQAFTIGGMTVEAGQRRLVDLPVSKLSNHTPVTLPVHVLHGHRPGPTMFLSAAIHGDELNGVEIIRRVLRTLQPGNIAGTLLCVPVVNAYGFIGRSRYLPDRRDLNRSFPGSAGGSLAARLAYLFLTEVVQRCQFGIDLHTAAVHRVNLPQIQIGRAHV